MAPTGTPGGFRHDPLGYLDRVSRARDGAPAVVRLPGGVLVAGGYRLAVEPLRPGPTVRAALGPPPFRLLLTPRPGAGW
jgi:hypothetical protein